MTDGNNQINPAEKRRRIPLAEMVAEETGPAQAGAARLILSAKIAILAALLIALNWWQFSTLVGKWLHDSNWSHGFLIPLFSLYLLFNRRHELFSAPRRTCLWGLAIMVLAIAMEILAVHPIRNLWLRQASMVGIVFGLVLYLCGPRVMLVAWLPIVYFLLAIPIPEILYTRIAVPLQELAAKCSGGILDLVGVEIEVTASALSIVSRGGVEHTLTVAEACSGVRSLMAFVALSVAMAYIEDRPFWQRMVMVFASVPIAVACNIIRVTMTCTMYVIDKPELGQDFMHTFMGLVLLAPALLLLILLGWLMRGLYVDVEEEDDEEDVPAGGMAAEGTDR